MYKKLTVEYIKEPYWDLPEDTEEKHKKTRVITIVQVEILTQNLPCTKHKCYPHSPHHIFILFTKMLIVMTT
jgi:hypothetical protein